ncbi:OsmC family protein [Aquibacillus sp. 3ASR75-11]|uniref:OsmC family protein n=1 Tax=Terrihalobacillus insolitus TaxID=2950438 RepID=A0A9X3WTX6_9BACI|nr:OsmC family protein [Terrihalobacillus insolitus]MDC3411970.1 OsmC family protein [Terrihalobacillus insolitus]MDC3423344.1 OsmC family protein [Terrihalobacillus insolitus]
MSEEQIVKVSTKGKWEEGVRTKVYVRDFDPIVLDEPEELGGSDQGPNPVEYVLASLSGCTLVLIEMIAKELNFSYTGIEFENEGLLDLRGMNGVEGVSPHFQKVTFKVIIDTDESDNRLKQLNEEVIRRCPVYNLLKDAGIELESPWIKKETVATTK